MGVVKISCIQGTLTVKELSTVDIGDPSTVFDCVGSAADATASAAVSTLENTDKS